MNNHRQQQHEELNQLYIEHEANIATVQDAIRQEISSLIRQGLFTVNDLDTMENYIHDTVSIFRSLRKHGFSIPATVTHIVDIILWRVKGNVDALSFHEFRHRFLSRPFCFFHKYDQSGRPILVIQMRYIPCPVVHPTKGYEPLIDFFVYCLEKARGLTRKLSRQRFNAGMRNPVVFDMTVLIDFKKAPILPMDPALFQALIGTLRRFPGMVSTVCLINFGWMFQGMWQICKHLLSEEAQQRVVFPRLDNLTAIIPKENLLHALGGDDTFEWKLETDAVFTSPQSVSCSRRSSTSSTYYDIVESGFHTIAQRSSSTSRYCTPFGSITPMNGVTSTGVSARALAHELALLRMQGRDDDTSHRKVGVSPSGQRRRRQLVRRVLFHLWEAVSRYRRLQLLLIVSILASIIIQMKPLAKSNRQVSISRVLYTLIQSRQLATRCH